MYTYSMMTAWHFLLVVDMILTTSFN